jgi:hypothetical protein
MKRISAIDTDIITSIIKITFRNQDANFTFNMRTE